MKESIQVNCPNCRKITDFTKENEYRPFCGRVCKLEDLGSWGREEFKIPTRDQSEHPQLDSEEDD